MDLETEARALMTSVGVCVLEDQRAIRITGDDALEWLQGQVTQDVLGLDAGQSAFTLLLASNGKIRTDAWVQRRADELLLVLPAASAEAALALLDAHVVMEDVVLSLDPALVVVTVQGPEAAALRGERPDALDADRLGLGGGFDLLVPRADADGTAAALEPAARARGGARVGPSGFELARVRCGIPKLGVDFGENTLPQEAGLAARAVSFTKGCYLGQEPVVMLEHRGRPPKRLFVVRTAGAVEAEASLEAEGGGAAGRITTVAPGPEPDGSLLGFALIKHAHATPGTTLRAKGVAVELLRPVGGDVSA